MPTSPKSPLSQFRLLRWVGDLAVGLFSLYAAFFIRINLPVPLTEGLLPRERLGFFLSASALVLLSQNLVLYFFGFYDLPRAQARLELLRRLLAATTLQGLGLMAFFFLTQLGFPRSVVVGFVPLNLILLFLFRTLLQHFHQPTLRRVAIVGTSQGARELARNIGRYHWHGLEVAGYVTPPGQALSEAPRCSGSSALGPRLGTVDDLPRLLAEGRIDLLVLADGERDWRTGLVDRLARQPEARGSVLLLPTPFESLIGRTRFRSIHDMALIEVIRETEWRTHLPLKRAFDLAVASLLLLPASPLLLLCALAIRLNSNGPTFYRQTRVGRNQRPFELWKLRTMYDDAESMTGEILASDGDPRMTRVGRFLRRSRLDELPQLFHVIGGTMSLVGPRPERPGFVKRYVEEIPGYVERFATRPGLTGLAQVNGDYQSSAENKLRYDLAYQGNWSLWLDLSILFRTVRIVLSTRGT